MWMTLQDTELFLLCLATAGYLAAWGGYWGALQKRPTTVRRWASTLTLVALALQAASFGVRAYRAGHLPIYSAYEFSATFAGGIALVQLIFERRSRRQDLGICMLPVVLALLLYAWMLPKNVEPVIPIFRSLWLKVHIVTAFVAYSSFAATFGASCLYLIREGSAASPGVAKNPSTLPLLDTVAYQAVTVGFSFLTVCVISGAIWAEYVWGRFWSWDPKETWSLITWLIFATYLHTRYQRGWRGQRAAVFGVLGFLLVLMTYVGVDYLVPRQHDFQPARVGLGVPAVGEIEQVRSGEQTSTRRLAFIATQDEVDGIGGQRRDEPSGGGDLEGQRRRGCCAHGNLRGGRAEAKI
jgi:cytochrome c-type biogenesis protein CcsB